MPKFQDLTTEMTGIRNNSLAMIFVSRPTGFNDGAVSIVVGAHHKDKAAHLFDKEGVRQLIEQLQELHDSMPGAIE